MLKYACIMSLDLDSGLRYVGAFIWVASPGGVIGS
jgi:hypothetical protein